MTTLSATRLLDIWEEGGSLPPFVRALRLLAAAHALPEEAVAAWSLGRRDRALLELRALLFGDTMQAIVPCPECDSRLELAFQGSDLYAPVAEGEIAPCEAAVQGEPYHVRLRPITSADLAAALAGEPLVPRCILSVTRGDGAIPPDALPAPVLNAIGQALTEGDPQADIQLALSCPDCGAQWSAPFDPLGYLWAELDGWGRRILREVHLLASAYGWRESEILALSAARRRLYLEMVTA